MRLAVALVGAFFIFGANAMAKANAVTLMKDGEELEKRQLEEEAARPESEKALDLVYSDEGFSETAYPDPASPREVARRKKQKGWEKLSGAPFTIGPGRTTAAGFGEVKEGDTTTAEIEREYAKKKVDKVFEYLKKKGLPENAAMASAVYNLGEGNVSKGALPELAKEGKWSEFADKLEEYKYANGKALPGLEIRRRKEANKVRKFYGIEEKPELERVNVVDPKTKKKKWITREKKR